MEGNGGAGDGSGSAAPPWDLGMHWSVAPAGSSYPQQQQPHLVLRAGGGVPSQHQLEQLTCLKLGKRPCCWAGAAAAGNSNHQAAGAAGAGQPPQQQVRGNCTASSSAEGKRKEKVPAPAPAAAAAPRCQVEGCHVALTGAKEYHRRHKVCEEHSKAPRVVVLGAEQRFCQQCSRFHAISEFDDAKRSCRRRLAGHNERRRKSNASEAMARGAAHPHGMMAASFGYGFLPPCGLPASPAGALSLLSSARGGAAGAPWLVPGPAAPDISARSSAALDELIAENRAALLAWQFFSSDRSASAGRALHQLPPPPDQAAATGWHLHPHNNGAGGERYHTTLDLMQSTAATASAGAPPFRPVPERAAARPPRTAKDGDAAACSSDAWAPAGGRAHAR